MMFGNSVSQALTNNQAHVLAQSYLDQARLYKTEQHLEMALVLYDRAKATFRHIADAHQLFLPLSEVKNAVIQARTPQTPEEEALRQRIAEVYFERAELLKELGNLDKAQASYKKAQAWGYEEMHPASIPSAVLLSASGLPPVAQVTTSVQQKSALVDYLFEEALSTLGSLETPDTPSLFLVYAHNNPACGQADASTSKYLIDKLSRIRAKLYSDQAPMAQPYSSSPEDLKQDGKIEDILTSQLCLLPTQLRGDVPPVNKVVVCCSEVLGKYLQWPDYEKFHQELRDAYRADQEAYRQDNTQSGTLAIRQVIRKFSQEQAYKAGFHHVLTEIAFLQIRVEERKDQHGIIPVSLTPNSYENCLANFIPATTVRVEDILRFDQQAKAGQEVYPNQSRHWVLFKLIERLLVSSNEAKTFLNKFWQGYSDLISRLKSNSSTPGDLEFVKLKDSIFGDIEAELHRKLADLVLHAQKQHPPTPSLIDLRTALDQHYKSSNLSIQRVSGLTASLDDCYINLAIVESQAQREKDQEALKKQAKAFERLPSSEWLEATNPNKLIALDTLFEPQKLRDGTIKMPKRILIQGRAGIGKTTLCKKLVYEYDRNGLWKNQFESILWVPLRQLKTFEYYSLEKLLSKHYFASQRNPKAFAQAFHQYQDKTLFILDGLDEVIGELDESRPLSRFLTELLNKAHVVITSRPAGVDARWLGQIDLELETVGFSPDDVQAYIQKFALESERVAIQQFIQRTPLIQGLVNIPIQLDALCYSWDTLQSQISAGGVVTVTALYQAMVEKLWRKDGERLEKTERGKRLRPGLIQKLSLDELEEQLVPEESEYLCYLAFQGLHDNRIEFDDAYLKGVTKTLNQQRKKDHKDRLPLTLSDDLKQISFLHTADTERHYHFLHLTFQEYFVAKFLVRHLEVYANTNGNSRLTEAHTSLGLMLSQDELKTFIAEHKYNPRYEIVWWMVAGLLKDTALEQFFTLLEQSPRDLIGVRHQQVMMGCLSEARAQLKKPTVERLEAELMQWFHFAMNLSKNAQLSALGRQSTFPEHCLLEELKSSEGKKQDIIEILETRSTLSTDAISALITALKDQNEWIRHAAVQALGRQKTLPDNAISALSSALEDPHSVVKSEAVRALGGQSALPTYATSALSSVLKDQDESLRYAAAQALNDSQNMLSDDAISALITALKDQNERGRSAAASALGSQKALSADAILALSSVKDVWPEPYTALNKHNELPPHTILALLTALKDQDESVRSAAARALGTQKTLSDDAISALITAFRDQNERGRFEASQALDRQNMLSADVISDLITALKDQNESVRSAAIDALGRQKTLSDEAISALISSSSTDEDWWVAWRAGKVLGYKNTWSADAIPAWITALKDENQSVRSRAANALSDLTTLPADAIFALIAALKDQDELVRFKAVQALARQNMLSDDAISALITVLKDQDESVRSAAVDVFVGQKTLSADAISALSAALKNEKKPSTIYWIVSALSSQSMLSADTISALSAALKNEDALGRSKAAEALGRDDILSADSMSILITAFKDQDESVRSAAAEALARQDLLSADAISILITAFKDQDESVRSAAAQALGRQKTLSADAISALITPLKDKDESVRSAAAQALGRQNMLSADAISALISALKDQNESVRSAAAQALGSQNMLSADAISALISALKDQNESVRSAAAQALGSQNMLSANAISALISAIKDQNESVRSAAAQALGSQKTLSADAISALSSSLNDQNESVKSAAAQALRGQKALLADAIPALLTVLKDQDKSIRSVAEDTLGNQTMLPADIILTLSSYLKDQDESVRCAAAGILGKQKTLSVSTIVALSFSLKDEHWSVRSAAASVLVSHVDALYPSLPSLDLDLIRTLYTEVMFPKKDQLMAPLYIHDNQLHFYTAKGSGQPIELTSEQSAVIIKALREVRAEAGIPLLPEDNYLSTEAQQRAEAARDQQISFEVKNMTSSSDSQFLESSNHDETVHPVELSQNYSAYPVHHAVEAGNIDSLKEILSNSKININQLNQYNKTALHIATQNNKIKIMQVLIERGATIDARDSQQRTPLHYAADTNNVEAATILFYYGASSHAVDKDGNTPLDLADIKNHLQVMHIIADRMSNITIRAENGNNNSKRVNILRLRSAIKSRNTQEILSLLKDEAHTENYSGTSKNFAQPEVNASLQNEQAGQYQLSQKSMQQDNFPPINRLS